MLSRGTPTNDPKQLHLPTRTTRDRLEAPRLLDSPLHPQLAIAHQQLFHTAFELENLQQGITKLAQRQAALVRDLPNYTTEEAQKAYLQRGSTLDAVKLHVSPRSFGVGRRGPQQLQEMSSDGDSVVAKMGIVIPGPGEPVSGNSADVRYHLFCEPIDL